ncbi:MAG: TetR/AcrR family transcriptional regulator [Hominenteromicrobium sp.]
MPPKPKFTKEEIAAAALAIIRKEGVEALTARSLGARLGTSARPIFTVFKSMDEVKWAARALALREFEAYAGDFAAYTPAFKKIGMQMVAYAIHEPEVFKLLFMQEHKEGKSFANTIEDLGGMADICVSLIQRDYALTPEDAETLFEQMWVHTFGLSVLCATRVCDFTEEQLAGILGQVFAGMLMVLKSGQKDQCAIQPQKDFAGSVGDLPYLRNWDTGKKREEKM